jgi:hypothetical protein
MIEQFQQAAISNLNYENRLRKLESKDRNLREDLIQMFKIMDKYDCLKLF